MKPIKIFGKEIIDENAVTQLENCLLEDSIGVLTADAHYGYAHPIGGAIAYKDHISLSGVGFDIGCGNMAVKTNIFAADIPVKKIMKEIYENISFGVARKNNDKIDNEVFDKIANADFEPQRKMFDLAKGQLGTVGGGNHYVDLFKDEDGYLWIGVHFGSRGFGHKTATGFIAMSQGKQFGEKASEGAKDAKPILFEINSEIGRDYIAAMQLAGDYAHAGREVVVDRVLGIVGGKATFTVHNHHNFAWQEEHFGETYWVVRKGCTPAFPGQMGFIGANMADTSVIVEGVESDTSQKGLYSTVHGAGRILSRTKAAGKRNWKTREIISPGCVDFDNTKQVMRDKNIILMGAGADESFECYKKLDQVLEYQGETIRVKHKLFPIGVAMAGDTIVDPYKD